MSAIDQLLKLTEEDLSVKKTTIDIEIERLTHKLNKKGIDEKFYIKAETVSPDLIYDYESGIYDVEDGKVKVNKEEAYKQALDICCASIIEPQYNDERLISFLGIKMKQPTRDVVWKKLLFKQEILSISQIIIEASRKNINEDEYNENLDKKRKRTKN